MKFSLPRLVLTALLTFVGAPLFAQKGVDLESELPPDAHPGYASLPPSPDRATAS